MFRYRSHRIACVSLCAIIGMLFSVKTAWAQIDFTKPSEAEAQSAAAKASPELVNGLAKELGSTPEQAAGAAGVLFSLAKSLLKPDDFAAISKAVPGMDALLAATPAGVVVATPSALTQTPGFTSSSPSSTSGAMMAAPDGTASAVAGLAKLGIKPEMIAKALPYVSGYLKKYGGAALGSLLGGIFKGGK
jgi:hypothetical protein